MTDSARPPVRWKRQQRGAFSEAGKRRRRCRPQLEWLETRMAPATLNLPTLQSETSVAVDDSGKHVVIGYNDFRQISGNPARVSGFMYSDDGGATLIDGGQLPSPGNQSIGATLYPQIFGDPEVKYLGGSNFVYASIMVRTIQATPSSPVRAVQTMSVHVSTDYGHSWTGPYEVTAATNPNGAFDGLGRPRDAADKEFLGVDPDTGRVMMSWSNFTPFSSGGVEISTTYSDNVLSGAPTWSTYQVVRDNVEDGQSSVPRFAGNGLPYAYIAWRTFPSIYGRNVAFARSLDNGATWQPAITVTSDFLDMDQALGNDRASTSPSLAVDNTGGKYANSVYLVYANNNNGDGSDIAFQRSVDFGQTWSTPILLNARPGADRSQWFPWVTVDRNTGRVYVMYYDQGIATSGDLTEVTYTYSDDGGTTWSKPQPLSERPFHAAYGNDTSQPNMGDYIQSVAQAGQLYAIYAATKRPPLGFFDGQNTANPTSMTVPDVYLTTTRSRKTVNVNLGAVSSTDSGGNGYIDPGEIVTLTLPLRNYVTNPLNASTVTNVSAKLISNTPGVTVLGGGSSAYPSIAAGATASNLSAYQIQVSAGFVPGTLIELSLQVTGPGNAERILPFTLFTGTPSPTALFAEDFEGVAPGTLPSGWTTSHAGGANTVPWTTTNTFTGSNAAFHQNAEDGPSLGAATRFERLFSPLIVIPSVSDYVTIEFDVKYNTEDDPNFNILAYDGFLLRITDFTAGRTLRSVLVDAFADEFTTGPFDGYAKHFPRSGNPAYFQDMSAWAGDSGGVLHVRMRLPGMAGSTIQLRFEYTQDGIGVAAGAAGVSVDNIVINNVVLTAGGLAPLYASADAARLLAPTAPVPVAPTATTLAARQEALAELMTVLVSLERRSDGDAAAVAAGVHAAPPRADALDAALASLFASPSSAFTGVLGADIV